MCVISDQISIPFISLELDTEASTITSAVMGAGFASDSREADCDGIFFVLLENVCKAEVVERLGDLVDAVRSTAFGVYDALGDTFRSKCERRSIRWKSWRSKGPFSPMRWSRRGEAWGHRWLLRTIRTISVLLLLNLSCEGLTTVY
jgi:hypothetical protein